MGSPFCCLLGEIEMVVIIVLLSLSLLISIWFLIYYYSSRKRIMQEYEETYKQFLMYKDLYHNEMHIK